MPNVSIDSSYGLVVIQDLKIVYVDDTYANIFGYESAQDLMSHIDSFLDLIDPKHHQEVHDNYYQQVNGTVSPRGKTFINTDRHGRKFTAFTIDHVIEWEGKPAIQVTLIDFSIVEQAHQQIKQKEQEYKNLILSSLQGIVVHRDFKPLLVNQAWVDLMQAPSIEHVLNHVNLLDLVPEQDKQTAITRTQDILSGKIKGTHVVVESHSFHGNTRFLNLYDNLIEWDGEPAIQTVLNDVTDKIELEKELEYKAHHDALTGLWNRSAIYEWFFTRTNDSKALTCLIVDIDNFKQVNDTYGHIAGDAVIRCVAQLCQDVVLDNGVVGRWGGEEFVIFLPDLCHSDALKIAQEIRLRCAQEFCYTQDHKVQCTLSIGMAHCDHQDCFPKQPSLEEERNMMDDFIQKADKHLYIAKKSGKNQVQY